MDRALSAQTGGPAPGATMSGVRTYLTFLDLLTELIFNSMMARRATIFLSSRGSGCKVAWGSQVSPVYAGLYCSAKVCM